MNCIVIKLSLSNTVGRDGSRKARQISFYRLSPTRAAFTSSVCISYKIVNYDNPKDMKLVNCLYMHLNAMAVVLSQLPDSEVSSANATCPAQSSVADSPVLRLLFIMHILQHILPRYCIFEIVNTCMQKKEIVDMLGYQ